MLHVQWQASEWLLAYICHLQLLLCFKYYLTVYALWPSLVCTYTFILWRLLLLLYSDKHTPLITFTMTNKLISCTRTAKGINTHESNIFGSAMKLESCSDKYSVLTVAISNSIISSTIVYQSIIFTLVRMYLRGVSIPLKKCANLALSGWISY